MIPFATDTVNANININTKYVLDGGALLQKIKWEKQMTYEAILSLCLSYVKKHYGVQCVVVLTAIPKYHQEKIRRIPNTRKKKWTRNQGFSYSKEFFSPKNLSN